MSNETHKPIENISAEVTRLTLVNQDSIFIFAEGDFIFLVFRCVLMTLINLDNIFCKLIALRYFQYWLCDFNDELRRIIVL